MNSLWSRVDIQNWDECWPWIAGCDDKGYGQFRVEEKIRKAYAVIYELMVGPVPSGLELDHLCRNRLCVNPNHLEAVTHQQNLLRSPTAICAVNARKTHCVRGHAFDEANTIRRGTTRECRACKACRYQLSGASPGRPRCERCNRGHEMAGKNLLKRKDGGRECKQCKADRYQASKNT